MADLYRNVGAPIRRDGKVVARRGDTFEPTAEELLRLKYKLQKVDAPARRQPTVEAVAVGASAPAAPAPPEVVPVQSEEVSIDDYHTGAGWYSLPGGVRVRGKTAAIEALGLADGAH